MTEDPREQRPSIGPAGARAAGGSLLSGGKLLGRRAGAGALRAYHRQVPYRARQAFRIDLVTSLLAGLYTGAVFPFVNVIVRDDLQGSKIVLATITAAPFVGNLLALFFAQALEGRRKLPFVVVFHLMARSIVLLSCFAYDAWSFALIISMTQVIGMLATPAYAAVIKAVYPDSQRGQILSYTRGCLVLAQIGGTLVAGWLLAIWGYRLVFPIATLLGLGAALVFSRIYPDEEPGSVEAEEGRGPLHAARSTGRFIGQTLGILRIDRPYRWFAFSVFTFGTGNLMMIPLMPIIQVNELHIRKPELAALSNLMQLTAVAGYFYWGRYVDRHSPQRAVRINILINIIIPVTYMLTPLFPGVTSWFLLPAFIVSGLVMAGIDLAYFNALLTFAGADNVSRYQALQSFLLGIRGTAAPFLGGWLADLFGGTPLALRLVFGLGALLMLAGAWMQSMAQKAQEEALAAA